MPGGAFRAKLTRIDFHRLWTQRSWTSLPHLAHVTLLKSRTYVAFLGDQIAFHSQFVIIMRDPASYFTFAQWISHHGSLPVPQDRAAFGGAIVNAMRLRPLGGGASRD